ncbi:hypothetical protein PISMIDRAFT_23574 [Pisolithus microcarpus 441]|uniref:Uncharacterized protein n=1 Tax=Pisolithus microcarpus 441 TaxID=765257 RepID=A0A0C9ZKQ3_9AGAM|nr:hypothetical protein BKA83DRAFT_23574 [Pisolithus microcarpus]KIK22982.1 hypothetical protein PISMIDRAFT_23574 [Pisolithus microcarpus 441]
MITLMLIAFVFVIFMAVASCLKTRCKECTQEDTSGISMDSQLMPAHLKCVQEEKLKQKMLFTQKTSTAHNTHPNDHSDDLASCLLTLTLTDDGPDLKSCAHKLWNSWAEFQESSPNDSIAEVTNDLLHLCLAWENVSEKSNFVKACKKEVATTLDKLELEVKAMPSPSSSKDPEPVTAFQQSNGMLSISHENII